MISVDDHLSVDDHQGLLLRHSLASLAVSAAPPAITSSCVRGTSKLSISMSSMRAVVTNDKGRYFVGSDEHYLQMPRLFMNPSMQQIRHLWDGSTLVRSMGA